MMKKRVCARSKFLALLIAVLLICTTAVVATVGRDGAAALEWRGGTAAAFAGGDGSKDNPYLIADGDQLNLLSGIVNGTVTQIDGKNIDRNDYNNPEVHYKLSDNIVLNDKTNIGAWNKYYAPRNVFTPIGIKENPFSAQFDGANKTISGAYVNILDNAGIFGYVSGGSAQSAVSIQNLRITESVFVGALDTGSVAGMLVSKSRILNCYSDASIISYAAPDSSAGGIVGVLQSADGAVSEVADCVFEGSVLGTSEPGVSNSNNNLGGIVGRTFVDDKVSEEINYPKILGCINRGLVRTDSSIRDAAMGGLAGEVKNGVSITDSGNEGEISSAARRYGYAGGLVGKASYIQGTFRNLWNVGNVIGYEGGRVNTGGIFGRLYVRNGAKLKTDNFYNAGNIKGYVSGGVFGEHASASANIINLNNTVNEGVISANENQNGYGVLGGYTSSPIHVYNFISYTRTMSANESNNRLVGNYKSDYANLNDSENIFLYESDIISGQVYMEQGATINFLSPDGTTHNQVLIDGVAGQFTTAWAAVNALSERDGLPLWVSAGPKMALENKERIEYNNYLPEPFAERFGADEFAWNEGLTAYDAFTGTGTQSDPFIIDSALGLVTLQKLINDHNYLGTTQSEEQMKKYNAADVYYRLGADIYLNDVGDFEKWSRQYYSSNFWYPIGKSAAYAFRANFDGAEHTVYGMQVSTELNGLFGSIIGGSVVNLNVKKSAIYVLKVDAGGIVAEMRDGARLENCSFSGKILEVNKDATISRIGGICGITYGNVVIDNCESDAYIEGDEGKTYISNIGGIIGMSTLGSEISNSRFHGEILSGYSEAGGICGNLTGGNITGCVNYGSVTGTFDIGGIVGIVNSANSTVSACQSTATAKITIVDLKYSGSSAVSAGGIVGSIERGQIINCQSSATITLQKGFVLMQHESPRIRIGGIVGSVKSSQQIRILNSRTTDAAKTIYYEPGVSGTLLTKVTVLGGIVGFVDSTTPAVIQNCINEMTAEYPSGFTSALFYPYACGVAGYVKQGADIRNCVNLKDGYEYGLAYIGDSTFGAAVTAHYNYAVYSGSACLNQSGESYTNNRRFDPSTGGLLNDNGSATSFRFEVSGILVANLGEALNAFTAENNSDESGALKPLADRLAYFEMTSDGSNVFLKMTESPVFFVRFIARRPDGKDLNGGFFIKEGGKTNEPSMLNALPVNYAGFTLNGWKNGTQEGYFDFSTLFDRNYTLNAEYSMDNPEISPTDNISITYDGKTHEIKLNPTFLHNLGTRRWSYSYSISTSEEYMGELDTDGLFFRDVIGPIERSLIIWLEHKDNWGKTYRAYTTHNFTVEIRKAPLTVSGLYAVRRQYDSGLDVALNGGELSGVLNNDSGVADDVSVVSLPKAGRISDKNVGTNKPVSFEDIVVTGADVGNYEFIQPVVTAEITPTQISLNGVQADNRVYDGTSKVSISANGFVGILGKDDVSFNPNATVATVADKNVGNNKTVTVEKVGLSGTDSANYECVTPKGLTVNITRAQLFIVGLSPSYQSRTYDKTQNVNLDGGRLTGMVDGDEVSCIMPSVGTVATKNVGQNKLVSVEIPVLSGRDADNYTVSISGNLFVDIVAKDVSIFNLKAIDRYYNKTSVVQLTSDGLRGFIDGDDVNFIVPTSGTIGEIYVGTNKPVFISWGTMQGQDASNYNIVLPELVTVNITPKPLSIDGITAKAREYDGTRNVLLSQEGAILRGVEAGDNVSFSLPEFGILDSADAGFEKVVQIYGIVMNSATDETILKNYTIGTHVVYTDISPRRISTVWDGVASYVYDGAAHSPEANASTDVNGEFAVLKIDGAEVNAGIAYTATATLVSVTGGNVANYSLQNNTASFEITRRDVTVTVNQTVSYVEGSVWSNNVWNGNVLGLVSDHTFNGTIETTDSATGTYLSGSDGFKYSNIAIRDAESSNVTANYSISYDLKVVIDDAAILYSVGNYIGTYNNAAHSISLVVSTAGATVEYSKDGENYSQQLPTFIDAGEYTVYFRISAVNYATVENSAAVNIAPAELTVKLTANGGVYTGEGIGADYEVEGNFGEVAVTLTYTGMSNGGVAYHEVAAPSAAGSYTVTATVDNANYTLSHTAEHFNIDRAAASIDIKGVQTEYVYNGREQIVHSGATLSHTETELGYFDNVFTEVGTGSYTVTIRAEQTDNYLSAEEKVVIRVEKATLSDATEEYNATYDGNLHGIRVAADGFLGDDDMGGAIVEYSLDGEGWQTDPILVKKVADSKTVYYRMTFENYMPISGSEKILVTTRELTIEGVSGGTQTYNNTTTVQQISGGKLVGLMTGDNVYPVLPQNGVMSDKNVGERKLVTLDNITLGGDDAGNYSLKQSEVFVTVTPRILSVQGLSVQNKPYDGTTAMTIASNGAILHTPFDGDDVSIDEVTALAEDANAGRKIIIISSILLTGRDKDNYTVTLPTGLRGDILPKVLDFTLTAEGGVYNGGAIGGSSSVSGFLQGESGVVTLSYEGMSNGGVAFAGTNAPVLAGTYTVTATLDKDNYSLGEDVRKEFVIARAKSVITVDKVKTQYTYTGYRQIVNEGAILNHEEAKLTYTDNVFTVVGTGVYTVTISVAQTANYESASEKVIISVDKAKYNMSKVQFLDGSFAADGREYGLEVSGELPEGVTVEYIGNRQKEAGIYTVTAKFSGDADNYEDIQDMTATLILRSVKLTSDGSVEILSEDGFEPDMELQTEVLETSGYGGLKLDEKEIDVLTAKDVSLVKNGQAATVGGKITVRMLIDEALRNRDGLMVIFIADDGEITNMNATREGDYMVFETDHNSVYAIVSFKSVALDPQGLTTEAIVGIVVGIVVLIALIILIVLLYRRRRKSPNGDEPQEEGTVNPKDEEVETERAEQEETEAEENSVDENRETDTEQEASSVEEETDSENPTEAEEAQVLEEEVSEPKVEEAETENAETEDEEADGSTSREGTETEEVTEEKTEEEVCSDKDRTDSENPTDAEESVVPEGDSNGNVSEIPVLEEPQKIEDDPIVETNGDAERNEPSLENAVVFASAGQSLEEAFRALSREQKDFYERLRAYALEKTGTIANKTQSYESIKIGRKNIVKFSIKRNTTVAAFSLEHPLLKQYKKQSGEDEGDAIKIKPTEVFVSNVAAFKAAKDMIDIVVRQIDVEREEARKQRNSKKKAKSSEQGKEGQDE